MARQEELCGYCSTGSSTRVKNPCHNQPAFSAGVTFTWNDNCSRCTATSTVLTATCGGTLIDTGAKLSTPRTPAATTWSATSCALSAGTARIANRICSRCTTGAMSASDWIVNGPSRLPTLLGSLSNTATSRNPFG